MLGAAACPCLTLGSVSPVKFPFHGKGRRGLLDRHEWINTCTAQLLTASTHSQPEHPARGDCTECPQLQQKYGNYTGREGIPGSSRLKNNSQFINARGNSSHEQGLSEKALKQGGQCLGLPKCRKRLGSCRNLSCFVQPHAMLFPYNIKALQKLTGQSHFLTGKYSGIQATRKWERKNIIITL